MVSRNFYFFNSFHLSRFIATYLIHNTGVCWIEKEYLDKKELNGDLWDNTEAVVKLANDLISCRLPSIEEKPLYDIVNEVQRHKHTKSCLKYNGNCRYGFPKLPSPETLVAQPIETIYPKITDEKKTEMKERAAKVFEAARKKLDDPNFDENMTLTDFYKAIGTNKKDYLDLLRITEKGKVLILKRECKERYINNYNPEMITAWNANMDLQLVVDPYSVVAYIASYMNKEEKQTTPFLREALKKAAGKTAKEKLKDLKEAYLTHREVGASEAAYKIIPSLCLKKSNISCIFVATGFPNNRSRFFKKIPDDQTEAYEDLNEQDQDKADSDFEDFTYQEKPSSSKRCKIEGREGTYEESTTVIDRYVVRPKHLENICLAQFAISYSYTSKVPKRITFDEDGCSNEFSDQTIYHHTTEKLPKYLSLKGSGNGKMNLRSFPAVMRIHSSKKKDGHEQQYSEMLLYTAWRDEEKFHADDERKCIDLYHSSLEEISRNKKIIYPGEESIAFLENPDLETPKPEHIFDTLDCQREQEKEDDLAIGETDDPEFETFGYTENLDQGSNLKYESSKYRKINLLTNAERKFSMRRLVPEQLDILREVDEYCEDINKSKNNMAHVVKPLRIVLHGGAGKKIFIYIKVRELYFKILCFRCRKE